VKIRWFFATTFLEKKFVIPDYLDNLDTSTKNFPKDNVMKKTTKLKRMLQSDKLEFIMEAHNGLSAGIAEEAGFSGIWGSGLSISAALGVRDSNEASWTQVLEVLEFMADRTDVPILLDGDTGYGNFNNARRLIQKLEQRGVAGVCLEDKLFPKTNSFINSEAQPLADVDEFALKIKACKDSQTDPDFCVVARVEAFIAGWPLEEALKRAHAYADAGADAILMHSKKKTDEDIQLFMKNWKRDTPVVIVPTKYWEVPVEKFEEAGVSLVIWANHSVRSCITAMQRTTKQIMEDKSLRNVEPYVAPVSEVFRLQLAGELSDAEKKYLPQTNNKTKVVILAASKGSDLGNLTADRPKAMLEIQGKSILGSLLDTFYSLGFKEMSIVKGYKGDVIQFPHINYYENAKFDNTGELYSLAQASEQLTGDVILSYGDILLQQNVLPGFIQAEGDIVMLVDANSPNKESGHADLITGNQSYQLDRLNEPVTLQEIGEKAEASVHGEMVGVIKFSEKGSEILKTAIEQIQKQDGWENKSVPDVLEWIVKEMKETVTVQYIQGGWLDIDNFEDLSNAYK
jgi:phosphoenolpyruvate phosphomutase